VGRVEKGEEEGITSKLAVKKMWAGFKKQLNRGQKRRTIIKKKRKTPTYAQ